MTAKTTTPRGNSSDGEGTAKETTVSARQPLAAMAQTSATMLRAVGAWHQVQLQALERAAVGQQQAADRMRQAGSPAELMTVQSGLMMAGLSDSMQYLHDLMNASMRVQGELVATAQPQQGTGGGTASAMAAPLMQAWQTMFTTPPLNGTTPAAQTH